MIGNIASKSDLRSYFKVVGEKKNNAAVAVVLGKVQIQNFRYSSGKVFVGEICSSLFPDEIVPFKVYQNRKFHLLVAGFILCDLGLKRFYQ